MPLAVIPSSFVTKIKGFIGHLFKSTKIKELKTYTHLKKIVYQRLIVNDKEIEIKQFTLNQAKTIHTIS
jgi:hypothetical protein